MWTDWHLIGRRLISDVLLDRGSNPGRGNRFISPPKCPAQPWGPFRLSLSGYRGILPGVKRLVCEDVHSPPPRAVFKNEWSYTSVPPVCFHATDGDNLTFYAFT
jgi:hypothetical protein